MPRPCTDILLLAELRVGVSEVLQVREKMRERKGKGALARQKRGEGGQTTRREKKRAGEKGRRGKGRGGRRARRGMGRISMAGLAMPTTVGAASHHLVGLHATTAAIAVGAKHSLHAPCDKQDEQQHAKGKLRYMRARQVRNVGCMWTGKQDFGGGRGLGRLGQEGRKKCSHCSRASRSMVCRHAPESRRWQEPCCICRTAAGA